MIDFNRVFELSKWLDNLLRSERKGFSFLAPSDIPSEGGIYIISDLSKDQEEFVYVGQSSNLSQRLYTNQLQGDHAASQIKNALVHFNRTKDLSAAKDYLMKNCAVRIDVVPDYREREMREGFAKAILKPEFALYKSKEH
jgi:exonuclease I